MPTLLLGHSRGGATAMIASSNPYVCGLVCVNAAYGNPSPPDPREIIDGALLEKRDLPPGNVRTKEQIEFNLPLVYFKDGGKHNPAASLAAFKGPKLVIHATQDEFESLKRVREIYENLDEPKMFLEIDCQHDYRLYPEIMEQVNQSLAEFVESQLDKDL